MAGGSGGPATSVTTTTSFEQLKEWFGTAFYKNVVEVEHHAGETSEYRYIDGAYELIDLPYDETITYERVVVDYGAVGSFVLIVLTFVTVVTMLRKALFGRGG